MLMRRTTDKSRDQLVQMSGLHAPDTNRPCVIDTSSIRAIFLETANTARPPIWRRIWPRIVTAFAGLQEQGL
ncbi:hypothetical protein [Planctellipticum variicoloris]|uniref:hypothetical protein n=1 Tax=Planctellipticum variicoloris TaxID=3064265 RepID=UPI003013D606